MSAQPVAAIIYLDVDDEITSAASRIRSVPERYLAIVLPAGSRVATSRINFRLLAREAAGRGRHLGIVTPEAGTRALAASAGLPVFATVAEYEDALADAGPDGPPDTGAPGAGPVTATGATATGATAADPSGPTVPSGDRGAGADATTAAIAGSTAAAGVRAGSGARRSAGTTSGYPSGAGAAGASGGTSWSGDPYGAGPSVAPRSSVGDTVVMSVPEAQPRRRRRGISGWILALVTLLIVVLVVAGVAAWLFLPSADVTVAARVEPVGPLTLTVRADPLEVTADAAAGVIPAQVVTYDLSVQQTFPATGKKVTETPATGSVTWTNCDPTRSYTIPSGTTVRTTDGQAFTTDDGAFLPVAILAGNPPQITCQSRDVGITAKNPGTDGNVAAGTITVVPTTYNSVVIRVTNRAPTTGGTHTETKIVTQKDVDNAITALNKALRDQFTAQLADPTKVPAGMTLFPATRSMSAGDPSVASDALVGQAQPTFDLGMTATGTATAVDQDAVRAIGDARIRAAVASDRSLVKDSVDVRVGAPHVDGSAVLFPVTARASQVTAPDEAAIRKLVRGLSVDDARERLRDYGDASINVWPGWVTTITPYDFRLGVHVTSDVATEPVVPESTPSPSPAPSTSAAPTLPPISTGSPAASAAGSARASAPVTLPPVPASTAAPSASPRSS